MITSNSPIRIPTPIEDKLREVRGARDKVRLAQAVVLGLLALFLAMSVAMLVDWTFTLFDPFWRSVLTLSALATAGITLIASVVIGLGRGRKMEDVAAEVDHSVPKIEERWSTIAELATAPLEQQRQIHTGMLNRLSQEATNLEPEVAPDDVVSTRGVMSSVFGLCAMVLLLLVACLIDWQQTSVLVKRFWAPAANISVTQLEVPTDHLVVARGEPLTLQATIKGRPVEEGTLFLQQESGEDDRIPLEPTGGDDTQFVHRIKAADAGLTYRMRAGDGQTDWKSVTVVNRPEIAAVRFSAIPPSYTNGESINLNELPEKVSVVEGTMLEVSVLPREPVDKVLFKLAEDDTRELTSTDGRWYQFRTRLEENVRLAAVLIEEHGLENKHPPVCKIRVHPDEAPSVKIITPDETMAARPDDEIDIEFSASDDFGIAKAELVIYGSKTPNGPVEEMQVIDIPLGEQQNDANIVGAVPLNLEKLNLEDGQELQYAVRVYDTRQSTASTNGPSTPLPEVPESQELLSDDTQLASNTPPTEPQPVDSDTADHDATDSLTQTDLAANTPQPQTSSTNPPSTDTPSGTLPASAQTPRPASTSTPADTSPGNTPASSTESADNPVSEPNPSSPDDSALASASPTQPSSPSDSAASPQPTTPKNSPSSDTSLGTPQASSTPSNASNNTPPSSPNDAENKSEMTGAPRPPDNMTRLSLDVAQSASSGMMKLRIDKWSGSFAGQQRRKLEMSISPRLTELDQLLEIAENRLRESLDALEANVEWAGSHDRLLHAGDEQLNKALKVVADLQKKSADTQYAFIGLQLGEIAATHLVPAGESLWQGLQAQTNASRQPPVTEAWQQTSRARQRLAQLVTQFDRIRREHALADSVEEVKNMYQVFVEDSFALLTNDKDPINNYQRKMAQFEVDEEYLKRLEEVLKMRQKLIAEFARILSEDPRLLRRFVDSINAQSESLRDQLTLLTLRQQELDAQVNNWQRLDDDLRAKALIGYTRSKLQESIDLAQSAAELQEKFDTWSPLELGVNDGDLKAARRQLALIATAGREIENKAASWRSPIEKEETTTEDSEAETPTGLSLSTVTDQGRKLFEQLLEMDAQLINLSASNVHPDLGPFVVRRLAETRRLISRVSGWVHQLELLDAGDYHTAVSVDQHQLARETNDLTASLADLEQQLVGVLQREDGTLPEDIAELSRKMLATLDERVAASQMGAVFALRRNTLTAASARTHDAAEGMVEAERWFDELMIKVLAEADKLPVGDPGLPDDPTLDELLALLENERALADALGIPRRPSNLLTMGDFLRGGGGGGGSGLGGMLAAQLSSQQRMMNRASRRASNRAEAETNKLSNMSKRQLDEWNVLVSELEHRLLQGEGQLPPEQYRRAIEQYFSEITRDKYNDKQP